MGKRKLGWPANDVSSFFYPSFQIVMRSTLTHDNHYPTATPNKSRKRRSFNVS